MSSELDDELLELISTSKRSRKRDREGGSPGPGGRSKPSKSKKRKVADSDSAPESEDGDEADSKYPLEGKYIDEEDREYLLSRTEIEREEILASRMDELERIRDRKHVDKLRAQQLAGVAAVENDSKRPARASGKDKSKDRTLTALKAKRKAKDEKKRSRGTSPKTHERSSSPMDMDMSESDSEDGQISRLDQEDERLFGKPKSNGIAPAAEELPLTSEYLRKIAFTRDGLAKHAASPWFEKIIVGGWVRYFIGTDEQTQQRVYRICQIAGLCPATKPYKLGERTVQQLFQLKHGDATRPWQMDRTSNDMWAEEEFERLQKTCASQNVALPTRKEVDERLEDIQALKDKQLTEADINEMIQARKRVQGGTSGPLSVAERSRLTAARTLAQRRQDYDEVQQIDEQLAKLGEVPGAGGEDKEKDALADRLAAVNARNRKANAEVVRRAEMLESERKKRERRNKGASAKPVDPSARLRTVPRVFESMTPTSRPSTPNPATLATGSPAPESKSPAPRPATNGKTFEAAVIESIEVDLGDF